MKRAAKRAKPQPVKEPAGVFNAERQARLSGTADRAVVVALVDAVLELGQIAVVALKTAFPRTIDADGGFDREALIVSAIEDDAHWVKLVKFADDAGVKAARSREVRAAIRKAQAYGGAAVAAAQSAGAVLPNVHMVTSRSWRVEVVDTPEGSIAKPAYVVRLDGNAPLSRLARPARPGDQAALQPHHMRAAEEVVALYYASMSNARLVGSYDGVVVEGGGQGKTHPIDVACSAWAKLDGAMGALLPVERDVIMEVAVYETPIHVLASRPGLVHFGKREKAEGAVVQSLRCGLDRLSITWALDAGVHRDASK